MSTTTMSGPIERDEVEALPPAPTAVYLTLGDGDEMTQQEIVEHTALKKRIVRHALTRLRDDGIVEVRPSCSDARKKLYSLKEETDE